MSARLLLLISCFLFLTSPVWGKGKGSTAADFLKIGASARQAGMGDAAVALSDDANAALWSPSAWARLRRNEASFLRSEWLSGISYTGAVYGMDPGSAWGNWGFGLLWLDVPDIQGYDASGQIGGAVKAGDMALLAGHGRRLGGVYYGANAKFIRQELDRFSAGALALDAGASWDVPWSHPVHRLRVTGALRNAGGKIKFIEDAAPLPLSLDAGIGYRTWGDAFKAGLDVSLPNDGGLETRLGAEYWVRHLVAFRAGYKPGADLGNGLSLGLGVRVKSFQFDYALADFGALESTHRLSLGFRFGGAVDRDMREALRLSAEEKYPAAMTKLSGVLEAEPSHVEALVQLRALRQIHGQRTSSGRGGSYRDAMALSEGRQYLPALDKFMDALLEEPARQEEIRRRIALIGARISGSSLGFSSEEDRDVRRLIEQADTAPAVPPVAAPREESIEVLPAERDERAERAARLMQQARAADKAEDWMGVVAALNELRTLQALDIEGELLFKRAEAALRPEQKTPEAPATPPPAPAAAAPQRDPAKSAALYQRGLISYAQGKLDEAILLWRQAVALDPKNERAAKALQRAYLDLKNR